MLTSCRSSLVGRLMGFHLDIRKGKMPNDRSPFVHPSRKSLEVFEWSLLTSALLVKTTRDYPTQCTNITKLFINYQLYFSSHIVQLSLTQIWSFFKRNMCLDYFVKNLLILEYQQQSTTITEKTIYCNNLYIYLFMSSSTLRCRGRTKLPPSFSVCRHCFGTVIIFIYCTPINYLWCLL